MELNILHESVGINETAFNQSVELNVDFDVNIPDYCGGIQKILRSSVVPRVLSKTVSGQSLTMEGNAYFCIIYVDDNNMLSNYEYAAPFSKTVDLGSDFENSNVCVKARCTYLNTRATSIRRLDVHSMVELQVKIICKKTTDIVCDIDCSDIFLNRDEASATSPISFAEKNLIIEEELEVGSTQPSISQIIRCDHNVSISEHKIINDKVVVKGDMSVDVLYCNREHGTTEKFSASVPFSQIIDVDGVTENCDCLVSSDVAMFELKPRAVYDGDSHCFQLNAKICISVTAVCNNNIPVLYDAFSKKFDLSLEYGEIQIEKAIEQIKDLYVCKKKLDFSDGDIYNIVDLWCNASMRNCHIEENTLVICGTVTVNIIAKNSENAVNYFERPVDFEYRYPLNFTDGIRFEPSVSTVSCNYTLSGDNCIEVRVELLLCAALYCNKRINAITGINVSESEKIDKSDDCSMVVYFAAPGEKVWDIAKKYTACPEDIAKINSVDKTILENKALIITC